MIESNIKPYDEYPNLPEEGLEFMLRLGGHADGKLGGKLYHDKPTLRIGEHGYARALEPRPDRPLRLEHNRDGVYYWAVERGGELHWWLTVKSTDSPKTGENGVRVSGTH